MALKKKVVEKIKKVENIVTGEGPNVIKSKDSDGISIPDGTIVEDENA